jgi:protein subunit release factor B
MMTMTERHKIVSLTAADFEITYERGTGPGGQKRNKTETKCRIFHPPSGAVATCDETRHQSQNRSIAFRKLAKTPEMQRWLKLETARRCGDLAKVEETVERMMKYETKVEVKEDGKWVSESLCNQGCLRSS